MDTFASVRIRFACTPGKRDELYTRADPAGEEEAERGAETRGIGAKGGRSGKQTYGNARRQVRVRLLLNI